MTIVVIGIFLALLAFSVYITRKFAWLEKEKAALENSKTARDEKIELLESAYLKYEAEKRKKEQDENSLDDEDGSVRFYPGRLRKDPDETN